MAIHRFFTETESLENVVFRSACDERSDQIEKSWKPVKHLTNRGIQTHLSSPVLPSPVLPSPVLPSPVLRAFDLLAIEKAVIRFWTAIEHKVYCWLLVGCHAQCIKSQIDLLREHP